MKLRMKGDSLRLRLSRPEVQRLVDEGVVEMTTHFAGASLRYAVETRGSAGPMTVTFAEARIAVTIEASTVKTWAESEQVGIYSENEAPSLAVEKDFACIDRDDPEDVDAFPNPKGGVC